MTKPMKAIALDVAELKQATADVYISLGSIDRCNKNNNLKPNIEIDCLLHLMWDALGFYLWYSTHTAGCNLSKGNWNYMMGYTAKF